MSIKLTRLIERMTFTRMVALVMTTSIRASDQALNFELPDLTTEAVLHYTATVRAILDEIDAMIIKSQPNETVSRPAPEKE